MVERDGGVRLVEILGHHHPDSKDFSSHPLALSSHELCRGTTIDSNRVS